MAIDMEPNKLYNEALAKGNKPIYNKDKQIHNLTGPALTSADGDYFYLEKGLFHRVDGPAVKSKSGQEWYYIHGRPISKEDFEANYKVNITASSDGTVVYTDADGRAHNAAGPAFIYANGSKVYCNHGQKHNKNGPAVETHDHEEWWLNGKIHRSDDKPASIYKTGEKYWYKDGVLHRDIGPAVETLTTNEYWINGQKHREDGPAMIGPGYQIYYRNNSPHRIDGPAVIRDNGKNEYYINGKSIDEKTYIKDYQLRTYKSGTLTEIVRASTGLRHNPYGPAYIIDKNKYWYMNGNLHREDGPAVIEANRKVWFVNGMCHKIDGPAVEYSDGKVEYWYEGNLCENKEEWEYRKRTGNKKDTIASPLNELLAKFAEKARAAESKPKHDKIHIEEIKSKVKINIEPVKARPVAAKPAPEIKPDEKEETSDTGWGIAASALAMTAIFSSFAGKAKSKKEVVSNKPVEVPEVING